MLEEIDWKLPIFERFLRAGFPNSSQSFLELKLSIVSGYPANEKQRLKKVTIN
jgi:hypothetical protein